MFNNCAIHDLYVFARFDGDVKRVAHIEDLDLITVASWFCLNTLVRSIKRLQVIVFPGSAGLNSLYTSNNRNIIRCCEMHPVN